MEITKLDKRNLKTDIPELNLSGCFIAGGCIRDSVDGKDFDDIDVFGNTLNLASFIQNNLSGIDPSYNTDELKTYYKDGVKIQVIDKESTQTIDSCLDSFDYTICQFAYDGENIFCNPESLLHLKEKRLVMHKISFPYDTLRRLQKYINKGYSICNGGLKEIGDAIRKMNQEDYDNQIQYYPDKSLRIVRFD